MNPEYRKWIPEELKYSIRNFNPNLDKREQIAGVQWSFDLWERDTHFSFHELPTDAPEDEVDISLGWIDRPNSGLDACGTPPPGSAGKKPEDGRILFNLATSWDFDVHEDDEPPVDFLTVCAHEIGHAIGLQHSRTMPGEALMFEKYPGSRRRLTRWDLKCYMELYESGLHLCSFWESDLEYTCALD